MSETISDCFADQFEFADDESELCKAMNGLQNAQSPSASPSPRNPGRPESNGIPQGG